MSVVPLQEVDIDVGLRLLMDRILMPSMAGRVSKLLESYAAAFWMANQSAPGARAALYGTQLQCFVLAYSIVLLNVDLHNPCIKSKMTKAEFVRNSNSPLPDADMHRIYDRVHAKPLGLAAQQRRNEAASWWERLFW